MRSLCLLLAACVPLAAAAAGTAGERVPALARFRLDDPHSPTFYVRYQDHALQIARSFDGLGKAKPLRLLRTQTRHEAHNHLFYRDREYAPLEVAGPIGRFTSVRMHPIVTVLQGEQRGKPVGPEDDFELAPALHFLCRDKSGAMWDYVSYGEAPLVRTNLLEKTKLAEMIVPDPTRLMLDLVTFGGEGGLSLELYVKIGRESHPPAHGIAPPAGEATDTQANLQRDSLMDLRRNGKVFPVRLTITDARGKVVHSATGDVRKFAMQSGWETPAKIYDVRLPKGRYTLTATIDRTPLSKPLSTTQQVEVK